MNHPSEPTIASILEEHQQLVLSSTGLEDECRCDVALGNSSATAIAAHQAAVLAEAGVVLITDDKVELAARAEYEHDFEHLPGGMLPWDQGDEGTKENYRLAVRAVIAALKGANQ